MKVDALGAFPKKNQAFNKLSGIFIMNPLRAMTTAEREAILNVLARNEELKCTETARIQ